MAQTSEKTRGQYHCKVDLTVSKGFGTSNFLNPEIYILVYGGGKEIIFILFVIKVYLPLEAQNYKPSNFSIFHKQRLLVSC